MLTQPISTAVNGSVKSVWLLELRYTRNLPLLPSPPLPSSPPLLPTTRHAPLSSILPSDNNSPTLGIEATSRATGHVLGSPKVTGWPERIFISCIVSSILPRKGLIRYVYCYLFIFFFFNKTLRSKIKMHWMMTNMNYLLFLSLFLSLFLWNNMYIKFDNWRNLKHSYHESYPTYRVHYWWCETISRIPFV